MNTGELFEKADKLFDDGKLEEAFSLFLVGANRGDTSCMTRVALQYAEGQGVSRDIEKSLYWDAKAAERGDACGALNAAVSFRSINEPEKSRQYFEKALDLGNGEAAFELALVNVNDIPLAKKYLAICLTHENLSEDTLQKARDMLKALA